MAGEPFADSIQPTDEGRPTTRASNHVGLVDAMLDAALVALRNGTLGELVRQRPRATRFVVRRFAGIVRGTAGDALDVASADQRVATILLRWLIAQLRPDALPGFERIPDEAWLHMTSWRPMLAVACHAGVVPVPEFRERYRRRADEAIVDNLCGLWNVGPSTFYRYQERGKRMMVQLILQSPLPVTRRLALRDFALRDLHTASLPQADLLAWHRVQFGRAQARRDAGSMLWHAWQGGDTGGFVETLRTHAGSLSNDGETDALVARVSALAMTPRQQFDLWLARAALARTRNAPERELAAYEKALQVAQAADDRLLKGIAYGALGKFQEARDADRAFASYQDSAEFLRDVEAGGDALALDHYLTTLVRLAWLYVLRNDARGKAVLERAEALRARAAVPEDVLGMLEQTWGEYWRRAGEPARSLEHRLRALNLFERIGDGRSVLTTSLNLVQVYAELKQFDRAVEYAGKVLDSAARGAVEPAIEVSTHLNLGATYFLQQRIDTAIHHYEHALQRSLDAGLKLHAFRARYNLAEAHYRRFREHREPRDEAQGDAYVEQAVASPASDSSPDALESVRRLKAEVLAAQSEPAPDRLQPAERAVHFDEMVDVQRYRATLAVPADPHVHVQAHLAIADAYLRVAVKEREAARELIEQHGLDARFGVALDALRKTFDRELTREQRLAAAWAERCHDLVDTARSATLVGRLLRDGSINKRTYAELCGVSPATASKHLSMLAERGLLQQTGKGPSTRYLLLKQ
jgi:tetratricopeptide (TPR) repeat protein